MNCVSCDICVYHLWFVCVFPGVFLSSRVTGACPVTTDLTIRVNLRTTITTTTTSGDLLLIMRRAKLAALSLFFLVSKGKMLYISDRIRG